MRKVIGDPSHSWRSYFKFHYYSSKQRAILDHMCNHNTVVRDHCTICNRKFEGYGKINKKTALSWGKEIEEVKNQEAKIVGKI